MTQNRRLSNRHRFTVSIWCYGPIRFRAIFETFSTRAMTIRFNLAVVVLSPNRYGILPVTLYGIPGIEADVSWGRVDGRIQVTNSSPANPQSILSHSQFAQWAAGAGYSFPGGLHIGVSGFRGPYLSRVVAPFLPAGTAIADFEASGVGVDAQWFGGPWSAEGEWQHFHFGVPGFIQSPTLDGGYVQVKRILSPRFFVAGRSNWLLPGGATDSYGAHAGQIDAHQQTEEIVLGYRHQPAATAEDRL